MLAKKSMSLRMIFKIFLNFCYRIQAIRKKRASFNLFLVMIVTNLLVTCICTLFYGYPVCEPNEPFNN